MRYFVGADMLKILKFGDHVIEAVRELVPWGAGNQEWNLEATKGWAQFLVGLTQTTADSPKNWTRPMRVAGSTVAFGAGNCQDQAAVAYLLLRETVPADWQVSFCVAYENMHAFAAVGVPNTDPDDKVVIVDSWPEKAQAVLWKHHFCRTDKNFVVLRHKPGGKSGKLAKALAKNPKDLWDKEDFKPTDEFKVTNQGVFNIRSCTSYAEPMEYCSMTGSDGTAPVGGRDGGFFAIKS
jgi:hypothetical protein